MNKKKVLILEGGNNEEHEVSLQSSEEIKKILIKNNIKFKTLLVNPNNFKKKIIKYKDYTCFNALHGTFGEDGQIQKILKKLKIKFTHSGIESSRKSFNKIISKKIIYQNNILTPMSTYLKKDKFNEKNLIKIKNIYKKIVIKPVCSGSSYGIYIIKTNKDLKHFLDKIDSFKKEISSSNDIFIEQYIDGKELTVSTIKFTKEIEALAVTEIKTRNEFFDYQAKYSKGYAKHILPAKINKKTYKKCLHLASKCHKLLRCNSIARSDFIVDKKNQIYYLETNTQPGLTSISLLPEQAKYMNISFDSIILSILNNTN